MNVRTRFDIFLFFSFFWVATIDGRNSSFSWGGGEEGLLYDFASFFSRTLALICFGGSKKEKRGREVDRENQQPDLHLI